MKPGTRVTVKLQGSDSLFGGRTGTVIPMNSEPWDVWVKLDNPVPGTNNYAFGFMEDEVEVLADDSTTRPE